MKKMIIIMCNVIIVIMKIMKYNEEIICEILIVIMK